jgi:CopG family nickel-responsive transcriptional regulator
MDRIMRVGVSFEPGLLKNFDAYMRRKGYTNRSQAIGDILRKMLMESELAASKGDVVATLTIVFDHDAGVTQKLLGLQHGHHHGISSTTHIHVDSRTCLEVLVLKGRAGEVRHIADSIRTVKGVKHAELVTIKVKGAGSRVQGDDGRPRY